MEDDAEDYMINHSQLEHRASEKIPVFYTYAVYLVNQAYGGREEGGWWYDYGERWDAVGPVCVPSRTAVKPDDDWPMDWSRLPDPYKGLIGEMHDWCIQNNEGRPKKYSVLSQGVYEVHRFLGFAPEYFPKQRPHYE